MFSTWCGFFCGVEYKQCQVFHLIITVSSIITGNNQFNPNITPNLSKNLDFNACDITLKNAFRSAFQKTCNHYDENNMPSVTCSITTPEKSICL